MGIFDRFHRGDDSDSSDDEEKRAITQHQADAAKALKSSVNQAGQPGQAVSGGGALGKADKLVKDSKNHGWLKKLIPAFDDELAEEEYGNYVITDRAAGTKEFEAMPIYVRIGMSLLFTGHGDQLLKYKYIENLLFKQSVKQGKLFDSEEGAYEHITEFVKTYNLEITLHELEEPDLRKYKTFNAFFARNLKPNARPADSPDDPRVVVSAADCRLTVWQDVTTATEFWIKGRKFTIPHLLHDDAIASHPSYANGCSLAIFRLAPADFHHWVSPMAGTLGPVKAIAGALYTVNPMSVRNPDVDVFTANKRDIQLLSVPSLKEGEAPIPIPIVSVGAMLVGSIAFTKKQGDTVAKADDLGYFCYGGSTVIVLFPKDFIQFDADLVKYSRECLEVKVRAGERIGTRINN